MRVTVLIPTYQEYEALRRLIPKLYEQVYPRCKDATFTTLILDDNSADGTDRLLAHFAKRYPRLLVSTAAKQGIGAAMKRGFRHQAARWSDLVVTMEADQVVDATHLPGLLSLAADADLVIATRRSSMAYYGPSVRLCMHLINEVLLCRLLSGDLGVSDHTAATRVIRPRLLSSVRLELLPDGYAFFPAMYFALRRRTDRVALYNVAFAKRTSGSSKVVFSSSVFLRLWLEFTHVARAAWSYRMRSRSKALEAGR